VFNNLRSLKTIVAFNSTLRNILLLYSICEKQTSSNLNFLSGNRKGQLLPEGWGSRSCVQ